MLANIKKELMDNPEKLKELLEHFGYCNVRIKGNYIQFGRNEEGSPTSLVIKLINNKYLWITDYPMNIQQDLFAYICDQRKVEFKEIFCVIKKVLNIDNYYGRYEQKKGIFGGIYERIKKIVQIPITTYDNEILERYVNLPNYRFLKDHISIDAQKYFGIRFDVWSQGIIIPIYTQLGELMGIKVRRNDDCPNGEQKYFYELSCMMSQTLYGYSHNYKYLTDNTIYVFEAEKSVMQCYSYGIRNCVALGSGSVSKKQAQMLLEAHPKKIVLMHDVGYQFESIKKNIDIIKNFSIFSEVQVGYFNYFGKDYEDKMSPSDYGADKLLNIIKNDITYVKD